MADFDEYAYLEKQLDKQEGNGRENGRSERSREKRSSKDKDRDRSRKDPKHRESSRHRDDSRERRRRRSGSRDKSRKIRTRSRERSPLKPVVREPTPPEVREQRERERELKELDRDIRTLFAYNLPLKADEKNIFQFFSKAGRIEDVRIIMDRNTRKSKGFAYIEFANREDIVKAMGLTGQLLMGQAVMVKSSEAEKNLAWEAAQQQAASLAQLNSMAAAAGSGPCKLLVSNLHVNISEADLKQIFEPFGPVDYTSLNKDVQGRSQGSGFVQYTAMSDAQKAIQQLDGMDIAGQNMSVKIAPMTPAETAQMAAAHVDLDDEDEYGGMKLNSTARAALMNRLSGANGVPLPGAPPMVPAGTPVYPPPPMQAGPVMSAPAQALALEQGVLGPSSPRPTTCILLKNMFNPAQETEPNWDADIAEDVKEECGKFGAVKHIFVDRNSKGFVYLMFETQEGAAAAQKSLHGRWFAGNQVVAEFQFTQLYQSYFRC